MEKIGDLQRAVGPQATSAFDRKLRMLDRVDCGFRIAHCGFSQLRIVDFGYFGLRIDPEVTLSPQHRNDRCSSMPARLLRVTAEKSNWGSAASDPSIRNPKSEFRN